MSKAECSTGTLEAEASCHGYLEHVGNEDALASCKSEIAGSSAACVPVPENFKAVPDPSYITVKVVPPYWHTFETDVKLRWRDKEILAVVTREFRSRPESYYQRAIESGKFILVNNQACKCDTVLRNGDHLTHRTLEIEFAIPWTTPVHVLYEDDGLVAAFKPAGMPVHPQGRYTQGSLTGVLKRFHLRQLMSAYLHPVNRLDRVTAGVVILAKNSIQARTLTTAIGSALKLYIARVEGNFSNIVEKIATASREARVGETRSDWKSVGERFADTVAEEDPLEAEEARRCGAVRLYTHGPSTVRSQDATETSAKRYRLSANSRDASNQDVDSNNCWVYLKPTHIVHNDGSERAHRDIVLSTSSGGNDGIPGQNNCLQSNGPAHSNKQEGPLPIVEERRRRKEEKRRWKAEKKQQRVAVQEQRQREHDARISRQNAGDEDLSIEDATRRGIVSLMTASTPPRCRPRDTAVAATAFLGESADAPCSSLVATLTERQTRNSMHSTRPESMSDHKHPESRARSPELQDGGVYIKVSARLLVSSCLVGRQLAVGWNEEYGKEAETVFKLLHYDENSDTSLVACIPLTGRTHQIRKHLQILGTSIVGDALYPTKSTTRRPHTSTPSSGESGTSPTSNTSEASGHPPEYDRVTAPTKRASSERSISVSFSVDELRAANRATLHCRCSRCNAFTEQPDAASDGLDDPQKCDCRFVEALREMVGLSDVVVSPDSERADVAYVIEEPCRIDLMSFAYVFDTSCRQPNKIPAAGSQERDVSQELNPWDPNMTVAAAERPTSESVTSMHSACETVGVGRQTLLGAGGDRRSTQGHAQPEAKNYTRTGRILKDGSVDDASCSRAPFVIGCSSAVMPDWTHPVKAEELRSLLDHLYLLHRQQML
uniref:RNA pseudouridine synthase superfamily protein n=1 Tax=Neospora caninum (strain Liverpool) TaxID=572307 RepID=A0A0F7U7P8_NEOCL|nr:TPA: RNA pseudouridine synthase superfamily protein [Neospora caninum Liverpool]